MGVSININNNENLICASVLQKDVRGAATQRCKSILETMTQQDNVGNQSFVIHILYQSQNADRH